MIRRSNSFFVSVLVHTFLAVIFFYIFYSVNNTITKQQDEQKVAIKLSSLCECLPQESNEVKSVVSKPQEPVEQKKVIEQLKPPKQIVKQKIVKTKEELKPLEMPSNEELKPLVVENNSSSCCCEDNCTCPSCSVNHNSTKSNNTSKEMAQEPNYIDINKNELRELIASHLYYPMIARKKRIEGIVEVYFELNSNGDVKNIKVLKASSDILSSAAINTIETLNGKFPKPHKNIEIKLPIEFSLGLK